LQGGKILPRICIGSGEGLPLIGPPGVFELKAKVLHLDFFPVGLGFNFQFFHSSNPLKEPGFGGKGRVLNFNPFSRKPKGEGIGGTSYSPKEDFPDLGLKFGFGQFYQEKNWGNFNFFKAWGRFGWFYPFKNFKRGGRNLDLGFDLKGEFGLKFSEELKPFGSRFYIWGIGV